MTSMIEPGGNQRQQWFKRMLGCSVLRADAGQSMIELALAVPLFTTILLGMGALASVMWSNIEVANAARAGAQYGAQSAINAADTAHITTAAQNDVNNLGTITVTPSVFCACADAPTTQLSCNPLPACSASHTLQFVDVKTSVTVTPWFHPPGLASTYTLKGESILRIEQ